MVKATWALLAIGLLAGCAADDDSSTLRTPSRRASSSAKEDDLKDDGDDDASANDDVIGPAPRGGIAPRPSASSSSSPPSPPPATINAFTSAPSYATITPPTQSARHDGLRTNAGQDCMTCHDGKTPGVPRFVIAGTVYATANSTTGARNVQVRVADPTGAELAMVGTDDAGNFWLRASVITDLPPGSSVGVRNALSMKLMNGKIGGASAGSCNRFGCHGPGKGIFVQ
jgi:hypothetical protein